MNIDLSHIDTASVAPYLGRTPDRTTTQFLLNIIPNMFVGAFSEGNVLQVLYVSVLCGFALRAMAAPFEASSNTANSSICCATSGRPR